MAGQVWDHECDVLVVGSGAGGLTAAVVAADNHAQVIVIEKGELFGGTSATSGGVLWIPASYLAEQAGAQDSVEEAFAYVKDVAGEEGSDDLIRTYVTQAREMLRYMMQHSDVQYNAIPYPDYQSHRTGGKKGYRNHDVEPLDGRVLGDDLERMQRTHPSNMLFGKYVWNTAEASKLITRTPGWMKAMASTLWRYYSDVGQRLKSSRSRYLTGGNALIGRLKLSLDKRGVVIRTGTALRELVRDGDGRIIGVIAEQGGRQVAIGARRGVILAAGGFERSKELRGKYLKASPNPDWSGSQPCNTGDALVAAMAVGAATDRLDSAWRAPAVHVPGEDRARPLFIERSLPGAIIVNQAGQRYMNESTDYHLAGQAMVDNDRPGAGTSPSFVIFDAVFKWRYPMGPVMPMLPVWMLPRAVRSILFRDATIGGLARKLGLDPAVLEQTVARFNAHVERGRDEDFHRGENFYDSLFGDPRLPKNSALATVAKGPFHALRIYPGDIGTNGGLVTDTQGMVVDQAGKPIAGLYATGNLVASPMVRSYPGGGATLGPAMTFGYLAARHAMGANR
ncbi:FAD-dependent oxidoreductase [Novosphingobium lentum]|uniref:FAD-dependent oxidoreductase n=1 Tax=Novosphingobium lentum TaxID=145287 RepID=UPI00082BFAE2|nr:FAD-dependent oxidoreductase [Novosphingobium lentum]